MARPWLMHSWLEFVEEVPRLGLARVDYMERILNPEDFQQLSNSLEETRVKGLSQKGRTRQLRGITKPRRKSRSIITVKSKTKEIPRKKATRKKSLKRMEH